MRGNRNTEDNTHHRTALAYKGSSHGSCKIINKIVCDLMLLPYEEMRAGGYSGNILMKELFVYCCYYFMGTMPKSIEEYMNVSQARIAKLLKDSRDKVISGSDEKFNIMVEEIRKKIEEAIKYA